MTTRTKWQQANLYRETHWLLDQIIESLDSSTTPGGKPKTSKAALIHEIIEKEYREILLEKAKTSDPWELITEPNLFPYPLKIYSW